MIFSVEKGCFRYPGGHAVLRDVCFSVESGQVLGVLGPNGAGKTTLLRCMVGLLRWNSGQSLLDGQDISRLAGRSLWRRVAYLPQGTGGSQARTVMEQTLLGRASRIGVFAQPGEADRQAARRALEALGLETLAEKPLGALSGGQRRMADLARALAGEPELLVLDEPEANLDMKNQLLVLDTVQRLAEQGMAVVVNTHHPSNALKYAHRALLLEPGGKYYAGETGEVLTGERLTAAFGVKCAVGRMETEYGVQTEMVIVR